MRPLLLLVVALATAPVAIAQAVCPGLQGDPALACVLDGYRPTSVLDGPRSKDRLYDTVDRATVGGQDGAVGLYTGYFVPFDGVPSSDPSQDVYNNDGSNGINQEHVFPRSRGTDNNAAERDMHHLFPTRGAVNSSRGNDPFGVIADGASSIWYRDGDRVTSTPADPETWSQSASTAFEPRAVVRGDVARAMFYVAAVYAAEVDVPWFRAQLDALLAWHEADPATADDTGRSERVARFQSGCRAGACVNPFVVDPTLARRAFSPGGSTNEPPASPVLLDPVAGGALTLEGDPDATVTVRWRGEDPDGDALTFHWELAATDAFADPLLDADVGDPSLTIRVGTLADALAGIGVGEGETVEVFQRVAASDGELTTLGPTASLTVTRGAIVAAGGAGPRGAALAVYPNPASRGATVAVTLGAPTSARVVLIDALGRAVAVLHDGPLPAGATRLALDAGRLPAGAYAVRASGPEVSLVTRISVVR